MTDSGTKDAFQLDTEFLEELIDSAWAVDCLTECGLPLNEISAPSKPAMRQLAPAQQQIITTHPTPPIPRAHAPYHARPPSPLREQDRLLPMANVARLMGSELPNDAKISRDAKVLMQELASEVICFLTSEANDISLSEQRKAISQADILNACIRLDLALYAPVLEASMKHFASDTGNARGSSRGSSRCSSMDGSFKRTSNSSNGAGSSSREGSFNREHPSAEGVIPVLASLGHAPSMLGAPYRSVLAEAVHVSELGDAQLAPIVASVIQ
jgi:histone H3/H4